MTTREPSRLRRWVVPPALAALMVAAAVVIPEAASASGKPSLEPITSQALVATVLSTQVKHLSGTLSLTANLGLPDLSELTGDSSDPLAVLSGTHTAQLWYGGSDKLRIAAPVGSGEDDLIVNGSTAYIWRSASFSVTRVALPTIGVQRIDRRVAVGSGAPKTTSPATFETVPAPDVNSPLTDGGGSGLTLAPQTPAQVATEILSSIGPTTAVKVTNDAYVAGRSAYQLSLAPRSTKSLVGRMVIAVDSKTGLPLRVQVYARGASSLSLSFGFTQISFTAPAASNFDFTPPKGAKVSTVNPSGALGALGLLDLSLPTVGVFTPSSSGAAAVAVPDHIAATAGHIAATAGHIAATAGHITSVNRAIRACTGHPVVGPGHPVIGWVGYSPPRGDCPTTTTQLVLPPLPHLVGSGWTSVLVVPGGDVSIGLAYLRLTSAGKHGASELRTVLDSGTPVSGSWGKGHLIRTHLLDLLSLSNGTILVGAVTPATLEAAAASAG